MSSMRFRQVHLDFHTSECIPDIGSRFQKKQFQQALKEGHVNSVTVFSKCHHGYAYHPTEANEMHPGLQFDLLEAQLEACADINVNAPVYLSAGFDEKEAVRHPEWLVKSSPEEGVDFLNEAQYHLLCYQSPYLDKLIAQVEEVMQRYCPSGIFLDISDIHICYCQNCLASMREKGLNPKNKDDMIRHSEQVYVNYTKCVEEAVRKYSPDTAIFHNAGNIKRGRRDLTQYDTHLELESLPTGGWGYDHFPISASYARTLEMDYLGMTGKFHTSWGEFGGFKHPNALRYEAALSLAEGAKCSVGDQLHPDGEMNLSTYRLIGKAYAEVESKEPWCDDVKAVADIAVLSCEAFSGGHEKSDMGANRILLEGKYLYDIIDSQTQLDSYKLLILPDYIRPDRALKAKLEAYLDKGGKLIATGRSGLDSQKNEFALELGCRFKGEYEFQPSYMIPKYESVNGTTDYVMYSEAFRIEENENGRVEALIEAPYFNRTSEHFSSHRHTPNRSGSAGAAVILRENTAYACWNVFEDYAKKGSYHLKEMILHLIEALIGDEKTVKIKLPDRGIVTLMEQPEEKRYILHMLFAHTTVRGENTEVIEDVVPFYDIPVSVKVPSCPKRVYTAPQNEDILFQYTEGRIDFTVEKLEIHQMAVIEF